MRPCDAALTSVDLRPVMSLDSLPPPPGRLLPVPPAHRAARALVFELPFGLAVLGFLAVMLTALLAVVGPLPLSLVQCGSIALLIATGLFAAIYFCAEFPQAFAKLQTQMLHAYLQGDVSLEETLTAWERNDYPGQWACLLTFQARLRRICQVTATLAMGLLVVTLLW